MEFNSRQFAPIKFYCPSIFHRLLCATLWALLSFFFPFFSARRDDSGIDFFFWPIFHLEQVLRAINEMGEFSFHVIFCVGAFYRHVKLQKKHFMLLKSIALLLFCVLLFVFIIELVKSFWAPKGSVGCGVLYSNVHHGIWFWCIIYNILYNPCYRVEHFRYFIFLLAIFTSAFSLTIYNILNLFKVTRSKKNIRLE